MKKGAEKITGVEAIMHTPFKENYDLDLDGAKTIVRHIIDGGVIEGSGCILIGGAVGEAQHMNPLERKELLNLYSKSTALIYPSFFESYGLPLVEANHYKLPTIASELDYVRDILDPVETFDPHSAKSICRSVKRFLKVNGEKTAIYAPVDFIKCMIDL